MRPQVSANRIRVQEWKQRLRSVITIDGVPVWTGSKIFIKGIEYLQGQIYTINYFDEITFYEPPTKGSQIIISRFKNDVKEKNKYNKTQFRQMIGRGTRSRKDFLGI